MGQVDVVDLSWVMGWRGLTCFLGRIIGGRQRQIQGSFASLQDDDVKQTTATAETANAGPSTALLTKCREQLRSG
jgi:hypothetical protein